MSRQRTQPLKPAELSAAQQQFLQPFTNQRGEYPNVFGTLARHMDLVNAWTEFGLYTFRDSQIDPLLREVLILRTALNIDSDYEWRQHRRIALHLGMESQEIEAIRNGTPLNSDERNLMVQCANDLAADHRLSDDTWQRMHAAFDLGYTLDAIFTVGAYTTMGMALKSCDVALEDA